MKRLLLLLGLAFVPAILAARPWRRLIERLRQERPQASTPEQPSGALLFVLPLPVALAALISMARGNALPLLGDLLGYGLFLVGALLVRRGLSQTKDTASQLPPFTTLGSLVVGIATALTVWLGVGYDPIVAATFGALAVLGCFLTYGFELRPFPSLAPRPKLSKQARKVLSEADKALGLLEEERRHIAQPELSDRLSRITRLAREILTHLRDNPDDLPRARKFLNVYLDGTQEVVAGYARTHRRVEAPALDERFRRVLITVEGVLEEQQQRLLSRDLDNLDVQIEVLLRQLEREGIR
ncbi:5-bromo-4-chloroindolyl phosphate hydrolysis family protein [Thiorhodococcus minor]|uniref:5-bromo-4-chloroindolyl phosphate hydrolase n=1 Tax=Thiorhodococcus minor TaxID=57489 RepID=A0A6M0K6J0_9GAMM|nr:5-bromo-4-chloroindolyl phosphate hydrolysis family protein [Thiorhodococcus minor]NEV64844.1 hypothetical protein [Thiorhodococcus minor]